MLLFYMSQREYFIGFVWSGVKIKTQCLTYVEKAIPLSVK